MKCIPLAIAITLSLSSAVCASACPKVGRIADRNCDGAVNIVVIGDSLVYGYGDTTNSNRGGYVLRSQARLPEATLYNFGIPGLRTKEMLSILQSTFDGSGDATLLEALIKADLVVLDIGRNDRWLFGLPSATLRNLKRARSLITRGVAAITKQAPLVVTAVMMYPNRGAQGPWMKELNALILTSHTPNNPADLRFDLVSKRLLSADQIHPTPKGYKALANVFVRYILKTYPAYVK